jgi:formate hydrogenlyase subunit 3/multisubunit Na+/H+ antiporter MnhD subunit
MEDMLLGLVVMSGGGALALATLRRPQLCTVLGATGAVLGCTLCLVPVLRVLLTAKTEAVHLPWSVPYGSLAVALDPLSAFFAAPLLLVCGLGAVYGGPYLLSHREQKSLGIPWFFYNILTASMLLVLTARNGVLFLAAWEMMALASFFLVTFEDEREEVQAAGRTYLIASHLGTAFLLVFFLVLGHAYGSLDFDRWTERGGSPALAPATGNLLFVLAVVGFGTKAGFMPFHVWLPEAHPAAPSHVSAVMSGVMIKTGIYGLVRTLTVLPAPPAWWGLVLIAVGIVSGIWGLLFAIGQHDLKRLLAYSTVENAGIIALGLGAGLLGLSMHNHVLAVLGLAGGLFHAFNHALFKSLLFLGAGVVLHGTGTRHIDQLGGLAKRMPGAALAFLIGAVAICGLPPFNGFAGEFLIYLGAFKGALEGGTSETAALLALIAALALIGGLAAVAMSKAFGLVFLGQPRSELAEHARAPGPLMTGPMLVLATACLLAGLFSPYVLALLTPVVRQLTGQTGAAVESASGVGVGALSAIGWAAFSLLVLVGILAMVRKVLLSGREVGSSATWGCGYARPTARMQYTGSSFVQPVLDFFAPLVRTRTQAEEPSGLFPTRATLATQTTDLPKEYLYVPLFRSAGQLLGKLRWLQHGYVHLYILYVGATLVALLVWYAAR